MILTLRQSEGSIHPKPEVPLTGVAANVRISSVITPFTEPDVGTDAQSIVQNVENHDDHTEQRPNCLDVGHEHSGFHLGTQR